MSSIDEPNQKVMESCRLYVDNLTKPLGITGDAWKTWQSGWQVF